MKYPILLLLTVLTGCSSTNITQLVKSLGNDPATVTVTVIGPYGTVRFVRTNPGTNQTVNIDPGGAISIKP